MMDMVFVTAANVYFKKIMERIFATIGTKHLKYHCKPLFTKDR